MLAAVSLPTGMAKGMGRPGRKTTRGTAPSAADIDALQKMEASDEAKAHRPSDLDAMGQDKRRQVIGHAYGPSRKSQVVFFVAVAAVLVVVVGGWLVAVAAFDQPADSYADKAPWSDPNTPQNEATESHPASPAGPCGEPGNAYPVDPDSPCAPAPGAGETGAGESGAGGSGPGE